MVSTEEALEAILALEGSSFRVARNGPSAARVEVFSVQSKRGRVLMPLNFELEVEVFVELDEAAGTYAFSGRSFEVNGLSMHIETFWGRYRRREWGKVLTTDGVVSVKFDTGIVFDMIEDALRPLGWKRA